jgi:HSP20 family protein
MTLVSMQRKPQLVTFNNFMSDLFAPFASNIREEHQNGFGSYAPVNIRETEKGFALELVAPGFRKEDLKINLENDLLTISAEGKAEEGQKTDKLIRSEYKFRSFKRSFTVSDKIDANNIEAKYENGVLTLHLPKKEEAKASTKEINVQ